MGRDTLAGKSRIMAACSAGCPLDQVVGIRRARPEIHLRKASLRLRKLRRRVLCHRHERGNCGLDHQMELKLTAMALCAALANTVVLAAGPGDPVTPPPTTNQSDASRQTPSDSRTPKGLKQRNSHGRWHSASPGSNAGRIARVSRRLSDDDSGRWRSDFEKLIQHCSRPGNRGANIARPLTPGLRDYRILKPKHSGFYATPLEALLEDLAVRELIITGIRHPAVRVVHGYRRIRPRLSPLHTSGLRGLSHRERSSVLQDFMKILNAAISPSTSLEI